MSKTTISGDGYEINIEYNGDEIKKELEGAVEKALTAMGEAGASFAKANLTESGAVDTGALRNSVTYEVMDDEVQIGTNSEYAPFIEFGTGYLSSEGGGTNKDSWVYMDAFGEFHRAFPQPPRPFIKPAVADHTQEYAKIIENLMKK